MPASRFLLIFSLAASVTFGQYCDKIDQRDADAILGGPAMPLGMGALGCSYSVRGKGARLTLTLSDEGANIKKIFDGLKQKTRASGWLAGDEPSLGNGAFGEWVKPGGKSPTGKCGFIAMKGSKLIQFYISDSGGKGDVSSRRETLDKLRIIAKRVIDRI